MRAGSTRHDEPVIVHVQETPEVPPPLHADPGMDAVVALQRSLGNRAVADLVGRAPSPMLQCNGVTDLQVQQGRSCWLYVLEALAKAKGLSTK